MGFNYNILNDIWWTSVYCNTLGIVIALIKLKLITSYKTNKSFTKTSVWMLVQLILGIFACIILALAAIFISKVIN